MGIGPAERSYVVCGCERDDGRARGVRRLYAGGSILEHNAVVGGDPQRLSRIAVGLGVGFSLRHIVTGYQHSRWREVATLDARPGQPARAGGDDRPPCSDELPQ